MTESPQKPLAPPILIDFFIGMEVYIFFIKKLIFFNNASKLHRLN